MPSYTVEVRSVNGVEFSRGPLISLWPVFNTLYVSGPVSLPWCYMYCSTTYSRETFSDRRQIERDSDGCVVIGRYLPQHQANSSQCQQWPTHVAVKVPSRCFIAVRTTPQHAFIASRYRILSTRIYNQHPFHFAVCVLCRLHVFSKPANFVPFLEDGLRDPRLRQRVSVDPTVLSRAATWIETESRWKLLGKAMLSFWDDGESGCEREWTRAHQR